MPRTAYTLSKKTALPFEDAVERVREELMKEGFGVLCEIDVQATLEEKLDVEREPYTILGACNPPLAHRALEQEPELGTLLPCNVAVYRGQRRDAYRSDRRRADAVHRRQRRAHPGGDRGERATGERRSPRARGQDRRWCLQQPPPARVRAEGVPLPLSVEHVGGRRVAVKSRQANDRDHAAARVSRHRPHDVEPRVLLVAAAASCLAVTFTEHCARLASGLTVDADGVAGMRSRRTLRLHAAAVAASGRDRSGLGCPPARRAGRGEVPRLRLARPARRDRDRRRACACSSGLAPSSRPWRPCRAPRSPRAGCLDVRQDRPLVAVRVGDRSESGRPRTCPRPGSSASRRH